MKMKTRRQVLKLFLGVNAGLLTFGGFPGLWWPRVRAAKVKTVLAPDTPMSSLINRNPADLDSSRLALTPLEEFQTMGQTEHEVDLENWRLTVAGEVEEERRFSYRQLLQLPSIEHDVLLICPGFFAYNARWKGVSAAALLKSGGVKPDAANVTFSGPGGRRTYRETYSLAEVQADTVFLAYEVNGVPLPEKHGYPLRVVAAGHYGYSWVKYVDTVHAGKKQ